MVVTTNSFNTSMKPITTSESSFTTSFIFQDYDELPFAKSNVTIVKILG